MLPVIRKIAERPGRVLRVRIDIIRSIVRKNHSKTTQSDIHAGIAVRGFTFFTGRGGVRNSDGCYSSFRDPPHVIGNETVTLPFLHGM